MPNDETLCLCGSNLQYQLCCQPLHDLQQKPDTAESLMRSRFTAYARQDSSYLLQTWDPAKRPESINFSNEEAVWTRLEIINTKKGKEKDNKGIVEFKAFYRQESVEYVMNEVSRFKKKDGKWFYLDGVVKSVVKVDQQTNQGKNAPCSCGSGKKYKRCCGKKL